MAILDPTQQEAPEQLTPPGAEQEPVEPQEEKADPELQDAFDQFIVNGLKILYAPKITEGVAERIVGSQDKVDAAGDEAIKIIDRLEQGAAQNRVPLKAHTVLNGANIIIGEIIAVAEAAGVEAYSDEQKYQAFSWTIANYISNAVKTGKITKNDLVSMSKQVVTGDEGRAIADKFLEDEVSQMPKGQGPPQQAQQGPPQTPRGVLAQQGGV
jgi:hypothetical protein